MPFGIKMSGGRKPITLARPPLKMTDTGFLCCWLICLALFVLVGCGTIFSLSSKSDGGHLHGHHHHHHGGSSKSSSKSHSHGSKSRSSSSSSSSHEFSDELSYQMENLFSRIFFNPRFYAHVGIPLIFTLCASLCLLNMLKSSAHMIVNVTNYCGWLILLVISMVMMGYAASLISQANNIDGGGGFAGQKKSKYGSKAQQEEIHIAAHVPYPAFIISVVVMILLINSCVSCCMTMCMLCCYSRLIPLTSSLFATLGHIYSKQLSVTCLGIASAFVGVLMDSVVFTSGMGIILLLNGGGMPESLDTSFTTLPLFFFMMWNVLIKKGTLHVACCKVVGYWWLTNSEQNQGFQYLDDSIGYGGGYGGDDLNDQGGDNQNLAIQDQITMGVNVNDMNKDNNGFNPATLQQGPGGQEGGLGLDSSDTSPSDNINQQNNQNQISSLRDPLQVQRDDHLNASDFRELEKKMDNNKGQYPTVSSTQNLYYQENKNIDLEERLTERFKSMLSSRKSVLEEKMEQKGDMLMKTIKEARCSIHKDSEGEENSNLSPSALTSSKKKKAPISPTRNKARNSPTRRPKSRNRIRNKSCYSSNSNSDEDNHNDNSIDSDTKIIDIKDEYDIDDGDDDVNSSYPLNVTTGTPIQSVIGTPLNMTPSVTPLTPDNMNYGSITTTSAKSSGTKSGTIKKAITKFCVESGENLLPGPVSSEGRHRASGTNGGNGTGSDSDEYNIDESKDMDNDNNSDISTQHVNDNIDHKVQRMVDYNYIHDKSQHMINTSRICPVSGNTFRLRGLDEIHKIREDAQAFRNKSQLGSKSEALSKTTTAGSYSKSSGTVHSGSNISKSSQQTHSQGSDGDESSLYSNHIPQSHIRDAQPVGGAQQDQGQGAEQQQLQIRTAQPVQGYQGSSYAPTPFSCWAHAWSYHLGSICYGTLIVALIMNAHRAIEIFENKQKKNAAERGGANAFDIVLCIILCIMKMILALAGDVAEFINTIAFVRVGVCNESFCDSVSEVLKTFGNKNGRAYGYYLLSNSNLTAQTLFISRSVVWALSMLINVFVGVSVYGLISDGKKSHHGLVHGRDHLPGPDAISYIVGTFLCFFASFTICDSVFVSTLESGSVAMFMLLADSPTPLAILDPQLLKNINIESAGELQKYKEKIEKERQGG